MPIPSLIPTRLLLVAVLALPACQPAAFDPQDPEVIAVIDSIASSIREAAERADVDGALASAGGDGQFTFVTGDLVLSGIDTVRQAFQHTYRMVQRQTVTPVERRIRLLAPDVALVINTSEGTYTDNAGWTSPPVGMAMSIIFVRENGQWYARHAHQSIVP